MGKEEYQWTEYFPKFFEKIYNKTSEELFKEYNENIYGFLINKGLEPYNYDFDRIDPISFFTRIVLSSKKLWSRMKPYDKTINFENNKQHGIPSLDSSKIEWWNEAYRKRSEDEVSEIFTNLEEFARQIHNDKIEKELFKTICEYRNNGLIKISMLLFLIRPEKYYSLDEKMQNYANFSINYNNDNYDEFCRLQKALHEKYKNDNRTICEISYDAEKYDEKEKKEHPEKFLKTEAIIAIAMYKDNAKYYDKSEIKNLEFCTHLKKRAQINNALKKDYFKNDNGKYFLTDKGRNFAEKFIQKQQLNRNNIAEETNRKNEGNENMKDNLPLNQILYGPPGTGKTYNTIIKTMEIIGSQKINMKDEAGDFRTNYSKEEYEELKTEFDKLKEKGRIEFVTFHQSYSYEEFIEGIKPYLDNKDWQNPTEKQQFVGHNGIFKMLCKKAESPIIQADNNNLGLNENPKIWKVSLMKTGENEVRKDCMENNRIRIGFDKYGEFITDETVFDDGGSRVLNAFIDKMEIGDIILSCYSEKTIDAIGVITSEYKWSDEFHNYKRYRDVRWLIKGLNHNILEINKGAKFTLGTVYQLNNMSLKDVLDIVNNQEHITSYKENDQPYVLIIDEINRGNISKIFGELITLIEPDKRKKIIEDGKEYHTIEVTLPYSNDPLTVPNNLYIIGTMNTADKSLALLDVALRRRFEFIPMYPKYNVDNLKHKEFLMALNDEIFKEKQSADYLIGHSYFMGDEAEDLSKVMNKKVLPLLMEYFNGKKEKVEDIISPLLKNTDYCIDKDEKYLLKMVKKQINE